MSNFLTHNKAQASQMCEGDKYPTICNNWFCPHHDQYVYFIYASCHCLFCCKRWIDSNHNEQLIDSDGFKSIWRYFLLRYQTLSILRTFVETESNHSGHKTVTSRGNFQSHGRNRVQFPPCWCNFSTPTSHLHVVGLQCALVKQLQFADCHSVLSHSKLHRISVHSPDVSMSFAPILEPNIRYQGSTCWDTNCNYVQEHQLRSGP